MERSIVGFHQDAENHCCLVSETCAFRPAIFAALESKGIAWRAVFDNASIEATSATVRADLAVTAWLASTVPADLEILGAVSDLPALPDFAINLYVPASGASPASQAMTQLIQEGYHIRASERGRSWQSKCSRTAKDKTGPMSARNGSTRHRAAYGTGAENTASTIRRP